MKNKFITILLSIVIAFGMWLYVVTVVDPESDASYYDVPVVFNGVTQLADRNLMITSGTNVTVDLQLSGNRTDLNKLDKTNITILADLSHIREAGEHKVKCEVSLPGSAGFIEVLNKDPEYITIYVSERVNKDVPVRLFTQGTVAEGFIADKENAVLSHNTVTVSGPKEIVEQIDFAAVYVDIEGQEDTIVETSRHTLCGTDGEPIEDVSAVTVNVSDIQVTVRIYQIKEIPINIRVEAGGGLMPEDVKVTPSSSMIVVSGPKSALKELHEIEYLVDLSQLKESQVLTFAIALPAGVENVSGITEIQVDVKVPEIKIKIIEIDSSLFKPKNEPEGAKIGMLTQILKVQVRGRENRLQEISAENIIVYVDFEHAEPGTGSYAYTIEIVGFSDVGVVYSEMPDKIIAFISFDVTE
jgi:YbbR domain-containing protein